MKDCIVLQSILNERKTFDTTNLINILDRLVHTPSFALTTLPELKAFILSLGLKDVEIEALILYLVEYNSEFIQSFTHLHVFRQFLCDANNESCFSYQINLSFLQYALIPRMPLIIKEKVDVIAFIEVVHSLLPDDKRLELFYTFYGETIQILFQPYKLPANSRLNQSEENIYAKIKELRTMIPSTYLPDYEVIDELIGDTLYEWSKRSSDASSVYLGEEQLKLIAAYEYVQRMYIHRKNQYASALSTLPPLKSIALVDVDQTLIKSSKQHKLIFNLELIQLLKQELNDIYLFTDMACCSEYILQREKVIRFLSEQGIRVHGVLTPTDLIADLSEDDFITLTELPYNEDPPSQLFIGHPLVQAIYQRFRDARFPSMCGKMYKNEQKQLYKAIKPKNLLSDNLETLMSQFRKNERKPSASIRTNLMSNLWSAIRHIEIFQAQRSYRDPSHIKLHVLKQFLTSHSEIENIYVFDDRVDVIDSIDAFIEQNRTQIRTIIQTKLVVFESISDSMCNYIPFSNAITR